MTSPSEPLDALRHSLPEVLASGGHLERFRAAANSLAIKINGTAFRQQLAAHLACGKATGDLQYEDVILVHGLLMGERNAIAHFYRTVHEALPRWLRGLPVEHDEVVQRLVIRLGIGTEEAERLRRYNGTTPFFSWIRVVATNIATDLFRERARFREFEEGDARTGEPPSVKEFIGPFQRSLKAAFQALETRAQMILIWHYRHQIEVERIARVCSVHRVTASRWLADARDALRRGTYERLQSAEGLAADEAGGLARSLGPAVGGALAWSEILGHVEVGEHHAFSPR
jgi:RNA polymerase sigma-70 factor